MELQKSIQGAVRKLEAQGVDAFEVVGMAERTLIVEARQQMVESFRRSEGRGMAIRVVKGGRMGFASTTDIAPHAVEQAVGQVLSSMREAMPSDEAVIPPAQESDGRIEESEGRPLGEIPDEEKVRVALLLESAAVAADSRIARVLHPRYEETARELTVVNSRGVRVTARRGLCLCELKAVASDGADSEGAYEFSFSPRFEGLAPEATARLAASRAVDKLGARPVPAGVVPVVFAPRAAAGLVKLAAPSFFADHVQRGRSILASRRGERAYHPDVSIVDDGLLADGFGSFPFDGEGIPRRRTVMVLGGVIEGWLYDGARAARDGVASTGSCLREGLRALPAIGVGNCFLKGGERSPEELVREAGRGLLVTDLIGLHTANAISGDFSLGAEGFLIEAGVAGAPVRGVTIAGNVHELFRQVAGVGHDFRLTTEYGAPSFLAEGLTIGA